MTNYFAAVYLDRHEQTAETADQVVRATAAVIEATGNPKQKLYVADADTGSDMAGIVISTAELAPENATALWNAYPYDEDALKSWAALGWEAVDGE